jgi:hypothetical protein
MDPKTGKFLWKVKTETKGGMSSMPVADAQQAYVFGGDDVSYAVRFSRKIAAEEKNAEAEQTPTEKAETKDPRVAWTSKSVAISSPCLYRGYLLVVRSNGMALSIDPKSGKVLHEGRLPGRTGGVYASPVVADGRFYVVSRKRGTFVYSADGKFELLSRNELDDKSQFNASPALVGKQLFLRSDKFLYCIEEKD